MIITVQIKMHITPAERKKVSDINKKKFNIPIYSIDMMKHVFNILSVYKTRLCATPAECNFL